MLEREPMRLLVVATAIDEELGYLLEAESHTLTWALSHEDADIRLKEIRPRVMILLAPGEDLRVWFKRIRAEDVDTPTLVIASDAAITERVNSLDSGADDVIARPYVAAELHARVRALGRRGPLLRYKEAVRGAVRLDYAVRRAWLNGEEVMLTHGEWGILSALEHNRGRVATHDEILDHFTGVGSPRSPNSVDVLVGRIRKKLGTDVIRTIRGRGYSMG